MVVSVVAEASVVVELRHKQRKAAEPILWDHISDAQNAVSEFRVRVVVCGALIYFEVPLTTVYSHIQEWCTLRYTQGVWQFS